MHRLRHLREEGWLRCCIIRGLHSACSYFVASSFCLSFFFSSFSSSSSSSSLFFFLRAVQCPFEAITIINLPSNLERDTTHRYSANSFKLHRLPTPRPGEVLGLVGAS